MKTFNQIAESVLSIKPDQMVDTLTPNDIPDWDSMNYLMFVAELEKEFNITFTMDEVMNAKSIGDVQRIVESKKV